MAKKLLVLAALLLFVCATISVAQGPADCPNDECVCQYIDEDGDGICDLCGGCIPQGEDDDGDGIPNGQDDDYVPPQDGDGAQKGK